MTTQLLRNQGNLTRLLIMDYLREVSRKRRQPPSIREIAEAVGIKSSSTIHNHLRVLLEEKRIQYIQSTGVNRNIEIVKELDEVCPCCNGSGWKTPSIIGA